MIPIMRGSRSSTLAISVYKQGPEKVIGNKNGSLVNFKQIEKY